MSLEEAVVDAGTVRFRPMLLTAAAVVVGASVILFDPIFQGLALSLMAGEVASTVLSRVAVPVLYYLSEQSRIPLPPSIGHQLVKADWNRFSPTKAVKRYQYGLNQCPSASDTRMKIPAINRSARSKFTAKPPC
jgi:hypothetical protein